MPLVILPQAAPRENFGTRLGASVSQGFQRGREKAEESKQLAAKEQAELRKAMMLEELKGQHGIEREKEKFKLRGELLKGLVTQQPNKSVPEQAELVAEEGEGGGFTPYSQDQILQASVVDPSIARAMQSQNDQFLSQKRHEEKLALAQKKSTPEYQRSHQLASAQASADVAYNKDLQASARQHEIKTQTLDRLEALNKKGVTGKPYEKLLEKFGLVSQTSEGRREFAADVKNLITDIRSILGGQFSQFEFQTILNAYPSADFSQGANEAIIRNLKEFQDIRHQEFVIANELKKENKGKLPEDFQSKVNERFQDYAKSKLPQIKNNTQEIMREQMGIPVGHTVMIAPDGGILSVPYEDVEEVIRNGGSLP